MMGLPAIFRSCLGTSRPTRAPTPPARTTPTVRSRVLGEAFTSREHIGRDQPQEAADEFFDSPDQRANPTYAAATAGIQGAPTRHSPSAPASAATDHAGPA